MKKRSLLSLLALLILLALSVSAGAEELPGEIRSALEGTGMEILKTAGWQNPGPAWFVLVRTPDGTNLLLCFEEADGRWVQRFHTADALGIALCSEFHIHKNAVHKHRMVCRLFKVKFISHSRLADLEIIAGL